MLSKIGNIVQDDYMIQMDSLDLESLRFLVIHKHQNLDSVFYKIDFYFIVISRLLLLFCFLNINLHLKFQHYAVWIVKIDSYALYALIIKSSIFFLHYSSNIADTF